MSPERIIIFQHPAKCGGTTLLKYLGNYYDEDKIYSTHRSLDPLSPLYKTRIISPQDKNDILNSHFVHDHHGVTLPLSDPRIFRFMFFREPLSRLISHWQMACRDEEHHSIGKKEQVAKKGFKHFILAIANQHPAYENLNNFYIHYLLYHNAALRNKYYSDPAKANQEEYKDACDAALNELACVGLVEDYDLSLLMLSYHLNIPPTIQLDKNNAYNSSKLISQLDEESLAMAEKLINIDRYVYQRILEKYAVQKGRFFKMLQNPDDAHSFVQKNYEQHLSKNMYFDRLAIDMSKALKGSGWHERETHNTICRWTGPSSIAYLDLMLNRSRPLQFKLIITKYLSKKNIKNLKIFVDGQHLDNINIVKEKNPNRFIITGKLETRENEDITRFTIDTNITTKPFWSKDTRLLGVLVESLTFDSELFEES